MPKPNIMYPECKPSSEIFLAVDDTHRLNIREFGNPNGIPVVVHHGGPGAGCPDSYARYFDPEEYRIILYDQRGAGKSTPFACLENNTSTHLVDDVKRLLDFLELPQALMFGGSWGATLPILFAEKYPKMVSGLILRGIFLGRERDCSAFLREDSAAAKNHPNEWKDLKALAGLARDEECTFDNLIAKLAIQARNPDPEIWKPVAKAFAAWEALNSCTGEEETAEEIAWANTDEGAQMGRMEIHFMADAFSLEDNQIIKGAKAIKDATYPVTIVHGKQDDICPIYQTEQFVVAIGGEHQARLTVHRTEAGHSGMEPGNIDKLVQATRDYATYHKEQQLLAEADGTRPSSPVPST